MFNRFSTYGSPINVRFPQSLQLTPQDFILGQDTIRVSIYDFLRNFAHVLQQLPVASNIRYLQVKSNAALLSALQVARTTQFQVGFGYFKPIIGPYHNLQPLAGVFGQFVTGH